MKMTLAIFAFALAATMAMPASAHMPSDCYGLAVERRATQGALIDALESLATFVHARAPMPVQPGCLQISAMPTSVSWSAWWMPIEKIPLAFGDDE